MPQYVYYTLCRICHEVNAPDPPGICTRCQQKREISTTVPPLIRRPHPQACRKTKRLATRSGALPWQYAPEPGVLCRLSFKAWHITIRRDKETRKFWYEISDGKESEYRRGIDELVFARIRSVRHLARMLGVDAAQLMEEMIDGKQKK